jgi:hypothetical protein
VFGAGERLFASLEAHLKRFPGVSAPIEPLLSAYLAPSSAAYAAALGSFIEALARCDEAVRGRACDALAQCKDDVEQDTRVVWKWLALRIRLSESDSEKGDCLRDAADAGERFEGSFALPFVQAVLVVWGDGAGRQADALARVITAIARTASWEREAVAQIAAAKDGDAIEGFRAIHNLIVG